MVLTRQQQRRQTVTDEQNTSPRASDDSRPILGMGDRENLDQRPRDTLMFSHDHSNARLPRESVSWSMGDHQGIRSQSPVRSADPHLTHAMQNMQEKVSHIEHSLLSVTAELRGVIQNFNASNAESRPRVSDVHARDEVSNRQRFRKGDRTHSFTSSDSDEESSSQEPASNLHVRINRGPRRNPKLPPFTGKETWKVWFNRFEEVANRQKWSSEEKLDELLPRLQGVAGEFVYAQLSHETRSNYSFLCKEINNRFRVVETSKAFWVQFSHRNQKYGETVEDYAAELKKLYDKAHVRRDTETRCEDLLRRFLDGLVDDKARFHVEFIKEPTDIDEAVYQVVCFQQTKQKVKGAEYKNAMSVTHTDSDSDVDQQTVSRAAPGKNKNRLIENQSKDASSSDTVSKNEESLNVETFRDIVRSELQALNIGAPNPANQFNGRPSQFRPRTNEQQGYRFYNNSNQHKPQNNQGRTSRGPCYLCGDFTHFKPSCPQNKARQQQVQVMNNNSSSNGNDNSQALNGNGLTQQA